jgi:hypothetical protein
VACGSSHPAHPLCTSWFEGRLLGPQQALSPSRLAADEVGVAVAAAGGGGGGVAVAVADSGRGFSFLLNKAAIPT